MAVIPIANDNDPTTHSIPDEQNLPPYISLVQEAI